MDVLQASWNLGRMPVIILFLLNRLFVAFDQLQCASEIFNSLKCNVNRNRMSLRLISYLKYFLTLLFPHIVIDCVGSPIFKLNERNLNRTFFSVIILLKFESLNLRSKLIKEFFTRILVTFVTSCIVRIFMPQFL